MNMPTEKKELLIDKYYVYKVTVEDEIIYVGKGKGDRYKHATSGKSHNFKLNKFYFEHLLLSRPCPSVDIIPHSIVTGKQFHLQR